MKLLSILLLAALTSCGSFEDDEDSKPITDNTYTIATDSPVDTLTKNGERVIEVQGSAGGFIAKRTDSPIEELLVQAKPAPDYFIEIVLEPAEKPAKSNGISDYKYPTIKTFSLKPMVNRARN